MKSCVLLLGFVFSVLTAAAQATADTCVFCAIAAGKLPAEIVYRDDTTLAFMDHAPRNPGHVLVVPIAHSVNVIDTPPETWAHVAKVAQHIALAIQRTDLKAEGFNFIANSGLAANQSVFHLHLHVVPRFPGEITIEGPLPRARPADLTAAATQIRAALAAANN